MALGIFSILRSLLPFATDAGAAALSFAANRKSSAVLRMDERLRALEDEVARVGTASAELAKHTQAIAEEFAAQAAFVADQNKKIKVSFVISGLAFLLSVAALIVAFRK